MTSPRFEGPLIPGGVEDIADWLDEKFGGKVVYQPTKGVSGEGVEVDTAAPGEASEVEIARELEAMLRPLQSSLLCRLSRDQYNETVSMLRSSLVQRGYEQQLPLWLRELDPVQFEWKRVEHCGVVARATKYGYVAAVGVATVGAVVIIGSIIWRKI